MVRFEQFLHKQGLFFWDDGFETNKPYVIFKNWMLCPIALFQVIRLDKFFHKLGLYFQNDHFEYQQPYAIFKIQCFVQ